jgi:hypothetical protein
MLHQIGLFFHMVAIMLAAGGSVGAMLVEKQLWSRINERPDDARAMMPILKSAPRLIMVGLAFFLVSGVIMLFSVNWIYLTQPWFIVKFVLFVSLPVRGVIIGRTTIKHIGMQISQSPANMTALLPLKAKMLRFHIAQFCTIGVIFLLVLFKIG